MNDVRLNCNACNTPHSMSATKVRRLSWIVVVIGWILTIPSILGLLLAILIFIGGVYFTGHTLGIWFSDDSDTSNFDQYPAMSSGKKYDKYVDKKYDAKWVKEFGEIVG